DLQAIADTTLQARAAHHFFHWELEFPEVFFAPSAAGGQDVELREDGGFDAVVGNPPYQRVQGIKEFSAEAANYFEDTYPAATGSYDIYILFDVQGVSLLSSTGQLGFIQPHKFFQAQFASEARKQLAQHVAR